MPNEALNLFPNSRAVSLPEFALNLVLAAVETALLFALQIARGMAHAETTIPGFVHRDLKPSNILVTMHDGVPVPKVIEHSPQETIAVISKEEQKLRVLPTVRIECPKCGNNLAYVWQVQTRGSDESSTQFFRCTKCNHTFREYS